MPGTILGIEDMGNRQNKSSALKEFIFWVGRRSFFLKCSYLKQDKKSTVFL